MLVEINNIGKVKKAKIDLSKNLIVFTGKNNSGKTWVSYVLYSLLKNVYIDRQNDTFEYFNQDLFEGLSVQNPIKEVSFNKKDLFNYFNDILSNSLRLKLPDVFANSKIDFSKFDIKIEDNYSVKERLLIINIGENKLISLLVEFNNKNIIVKLEYNEGSLGDTLSEELFKKYKMVQVRNGLISDLTILGWFLSDKAVNFIPTERVGISIFSTEISANRISNSNNVQYQLPIRDALSDWVRIPNFINLAKESKFSKIALEIENDILGGNLVLGEGGSVQYNYNVKDSLSYFNTASNIKSLSHLIFYLKYYANSGNILFIDEPEINLHPDNQRKIAKYLARISNLGIKVIVSTHSDYIIREFNNLIMLSKDVKATSELMKEYDYTNDDILKKDFVGAYYFENSKVDELEVSETGFEVKSIDNTIEKQNSIANKIFFTLFD